MINSDLLIVYLNLRIYSSFSVKLMSFLCDFVYGHIFTAHEYFRQLFSPADIAITTREEIHKLA